MLVDQDTLLNISDLNVKLTKALRFKKLKSCELVPMMASGEIIVTAMEQTLPQVKAFIRSA